MTTWSTTDLAGPIALSNGNLTATATSSAAQGVRSTTSRSSGKVYLEFTMATMVANTSGATVGIANATEILNSSAQLGASVNSMGFYPSNPNQSTYVNSVNLNSITASVAGTVIVGMAIDFTTTPPTLYVTDQVMQAAGLPWNNLAGANPTTSTQGISLTGLTGAPYFAAYNDFADSPGIACTANFGGKAFAYPVPAGYTPWDGTADWIQPPAPPPRRARARQQANMAFLPVVAPSEIVTVDKWFHLPSQPVRRTQMRQPGGAIGTFLQTAPEIVTPDKWFQPPSQPIKRRGALQIPPIFVPVVASAEIVTADKWLQPTSQPVRRVSRYATLAAGPLLQTVILSPTQRRALVSWLD